MMRARGATVRHELCVLPMPPLHFPSSPEDLLGQLEASIVSCPHFGHRDLTTSASLVGVDAVPPEAWPPFYLRECVMSADVIPPLAANMNAAFKKVRGAIGATDPALRELIVAKIVELAKDGVYDIEELSSRTLSSLKQAG
jgi:hypothetical protein